MSTHGANSSATNQRFNRRPGQIHGAYASNNNEESSHMYFSFPPLLPFQATPSARGAVDRWWQFQDRAIAEPSGLTITPATLPVRVLVLNNFMPRDANQRTRHLIPETSTRVPTQQNSPILTQDESTLTQDEQTTALKKLKKEVYNPTPKKIIQRLGQYYRNNNAQKSFSEKEKEIDDEDGKSCAICLEEFEPKQVVMLTPCTHMFHEECIVPWVKSHGQCPVCRFALCDRIRESAVISNNNQANASAFDAGELMSAIRAREEAFAWRNTRALHDY